MNQICGLSKRVSNRERERESIESPAELDRTTAEDNLHSICAQSKDKDSRTAIAKFIER